MCNQAPLRISKSTSETAKPPFPIQNIPGTMLAKVDKKDGSPAAFGGLVHYSTNQAYFIIQQLDASLAKKAVAVSIPDINEPLNLRIDEVHDALPNRSHLPMYIQVHHNPAERLILEHLIDNLAEATLGRQNLELKKNITIDLFDSDSDAYLRDRAGFFVTDRQQFRQLRVPTAAALPLLKKDEGTLIEKFHANDLQDLIDYDNTLSAQTRPEYLQWLSSACKVYVARPRNSAQEDDEKLNLGGYLVIGGEDNRVLALYAQTKEVAETLLRTYVEEVKPKNITLCAIREHWQELEKLPGAEVRPIYRRHTRSVPGKVQWDRIFAVNVGMNLF